MKFKLILVYIAYIFCHSNVLAKAMNEPNCDVTELLQHLNGPNPNENGIKTTFIDLNPDCIYLIVEKLDLLDLLSVAQLSEPLSHIVANVFKRFHFEKVIINVLFRFKKGEPYRIINNNLEIFEYEPALALVKYLGHSIRNLGIVTHQDCFKQTANITEYVNENCHESLVEFDFTPMRPIYDMKKPFINVEHVILTPHSSGATNLQKTLQMNELFPALRRLTLYKTYTETDYIVCHLPNLVHFHLKKPPYDIDWNRSHIKDFLALNPHIQSLEMGSTTIQFLDAAQKALPSLKNLTLHHHLDETEPIHFDTVKIFRIVDGWYPKNISISHLEELHINAQQNRFVNWIDFIEKHKNISRFFMEYSFITDEHFETVSQHLINIEEMSITYRRGTRLSPDTIIRFMNSSTQLLKLNLDSSTESERKAYHDELEEEWIITENKDDNGISFERKEQDDVLIEGPEFDRNN